MYAGLDLGTDPSTPAQLATLERVLRSPRLRIVRLTGDARVGELATRHQLEHRRGDPAGEGMLVALAPRGARPSGRGDVLVVHPDGSTSSFKRQPRAAPTIEVAPAATPREGWVEVDPRTWEPVATAR